MSKQRIVIAKSVSSSGFKAWYEGSVSLRGYGGTMKEAIGDLIWNSRTQIVEEGSEAQRKGWVVLEMPWEKEDVDEHSGK